MTSEIDQKKRAFLQSTAASAAGLVLGTRALGTVSESAEPALVEKLTQVLRLDGPEWQVQIDPKNSGRQDHWHGTAGSNAKPIAVPGVIQTAFPDAGAPQQTSSRAEYKAHNVRPYPASL